MEDPWSTPWAVNTPSVSPGLPPTKPQAAAATADVLSVPGGGGGTITPMKGSLGLGRLDTLSDSPWGGATTTTSYNLGLDDNGTNATRQNGTQNNEEEDDDGWGGWDDGKQQNAWSNQNGGSGILASSSKGLDDSKADDGFSAPWGFMESGEHGATDRQQQQHRRIKDVTDSAVSFGEEGGRYDKLDDSAQEDGTAAGEQTTKNTVSLLADEQDAWAAHQGQVVLKSEAIAEMDQTTTTVSEEEGTNHAAEVDKSDNDTEDRILESPGTTGDWQDDDDSQLQQQQKAASKVQELVDMYDGIAKKAIHTPPPEKMSREPTPKPAAELVDREVIADLQQPESDEEMPSLDAEVDLGRSEATEEQHEAGDADKEESVALESVAVKDEHVLVDSTDEDSTVPTAVEYTQSSVEKEETTGPLTDAKETRIFTSTSKSNHPPYPIDISHLDTLFPNAKPSTTTPEPVPDFIIGNSFTTTSERKTWYRISRFGSTHKHDSGHEDNYRRITWPASEVRTKTLHIVRRWMEEDSIAGRVVLGSKKAGVPLGASMFNWDSNEPEIAIGELLRQRVQQQQKKKSVAHVRNRSWTPATEEGGLVPQTPTMESFGGWNASVPSTPSAVVQSPAFAAHIKAKAGSALKPPLPPDSPAEVLPRSPWDEDDDSVRQDKEAAERKRSNELMPPPAAPRVHNVAAIETGKVSTMKQPPGSEEANDEEDDDDDWGEMISSPTVGSSATFASLGAPAEIRPEAAPAQTAFDGGFGGLGLFESPAPAKPTPPAMARPNAPPPIQITTGVQESHTATAALSPARTPTMNSPALEPTRSSTGARRISLEKSQKASASGTPTMISTPVLDSGRVSMNSNRPSMENTWAPTPTTDTNDMDKSWQPTTAALGTDVESYSATTPPAGSKRVSFEDTCTKDQEAVIEEALRTLPDLSYMLR